MTPFRASPGFTETWQHFDFAVDNGVATLTFNRPDKLNALTFDVYADLRDLLAELPHRGDARVLVITGEGRGFCSGGDVEEIIGELQRHGGRRAARVHADDRRGGQGAARVPAAGDRGDQRRGCRGRLGDRAGQRLPAHGAQARRSPSSSPGSDCPVPTWGRRTCMPRIVGLGRATELLMLGDKVSAEEAERIGLATQVVDDLPAAAGRRSRAASPTGPRWPTRRRRSC